jgi:chromosome segregation ATPase
MNYYDQLGQLMAKVDYCTTMLANGRCRPDELSAAQRSLEEFNRCVAEPGGTVTEYSPLSPGGGTVTDSLSLGIEIEAPSVVQKKGIDFDVYEYDSDLKSVRHRLLMAHRELRTRQSTLGNQLAMIPKDVVALDACTELTSIQKKIEGVWDQIRFIERNGRLPDPALDKEPEELTELEKVKLIKLKVDLKAARDQRDKLQKKVDNPAAHAKSFKNLQTKPAEWAAELANIKKEIEVMEVEKDNLLRKEVGN